jgi:hypothetical protein
MNPVGERYAQELQRYAGPLVFLPLRRHLSRVDYARRRFGYPYVGFYYGNYYAPDYAYSYAPPYWK